MSLQSKFTILLGLVALMVAVSVGAAGWSISVLQRESAGVFVGAASLLSSLESLEQKLVDFRDDLAVATTEPDAAGRVRQLGRALAAEAEALAGRSDFQSRVGATNARALSVRLLAIHDDLAAAQEVGTLGEIRARALDDGAARAQALVRLLERRVLTFAEDSIEHGLQVQRRLRLVLALALLGSALVSILAVALLRRWILIPIDHLREAAKRLAAGDFQHRVPEDSRDELGLLAADMNSMSGMIVQMQEERIGRERLAAIGQMVRRLAHNLRNPLAAIRGLAELTRDELPHGTPLVEYQDRIVASVDKFEQWLAELLDATSPMVMQKHRVNVSEWLDSIVEAIRPMAMVQEVTLSVDSKMAPTEASFDDRHLGVAAVAVMTNAIEAAGRGGQVRVRASSSPDAPSTWELGIADSGPGIASDLLPRIFAADFTTKRHGNGIGLAVALEVARGHDGTIQALSPGDPGRRFADGLPGAVFVIRLPVQNGPNGGAASEKGSARGEDFGHRG